jgi:hypothetical protein
MSVDLVDEVLAQLPPEPRLLREVGVRLIEASERARFDELMARKHYLKIAQALGAVLRYGAEYRGQWVGLRVFSSPAYHLKWRDQWLHGPAREVAHRRPWIAQKARFLVRAAPGQWPNLASRVLKPSCPVASEELDSLWDCFHHDLTDPRKAKGKRHQLATLLTMAGLAVTAGCKNPHAIAQFAENLNPGQRRRLRCRPRAGPARQFDGPGERTFRRLLKGVKVQALKEILIRWMDRRDERPLEGVHVDGTVIKNADRAPGRDLAKAAEIDTPTEDQKPKADKALTLVNVVTPQQRLASPQKRS